MRPIASPRACRCWGYPVVPVLFVLASALMVVLSIMDEPGVTLPWLGVLAVGVPVYYAWRRWRPPELGDAVVADTVASMSLEARGREVAAS